MEDYKTSNLWFVTSMLTYGIKWSSLDKTEPKRKLFIFSETPDFLLARAEYYAGRLNVPALLMEENYKHLLDVVKKHED